MKRAGGKEAGRERGHSLTASQPSPTDRPIWNSGLHAAHLSSGRAECQLTGACWAEYGRAHASYKLAPSMWLTSPPRPSADGRKVLTSKAASQAVLPVHVPGWARENQPQGSPTEGKTPERARQMVRDSAEGSGLHPDPNPKVGRALGGAPTSYVGVHGALPAPTTSVSSHSPERPNTCQMWAACRDQVHFPRVL